MSDFHPDNVGYYGKPLSSLTKEELLKAVLELTEIIHNCPVKGKCYEILERIEKEKIKINP
ncbi:MAG: hypothetical protein OEV45_14450 [Desulfobacteraceae bacterium]|nr:hypothetical protein [Desulfobacteraceae bacterium]